MSERESLWQRAGKLADATPADRNRTVDFLRAASIALVVIGHWLVAAPYFAADGSFAVGHMLSLAPWTHWLTLGVQVMPIFFLVGGYANAVAWESAQRNGTPYHRWLEARQRRLLAPVLPVLLAWIGISVVALAAGVSAEWVGLVTQLALVPTWFLAVYVLVGVVVPLTHRAWRRYGFASFAALVAGAVLIDAIAIGVGMRGVGYVNYGFVWLAIHQLGYAWRDGRFNGRLVWAAAGAAALALLVRFGPYPLAMVGVPGEALGNTAPPTLALLALGVAQTGLVLALEPLAKRLLALRRVWTGTVLVNGMIMTLFLWHMTAMLIVLALSMLVGGAGLHVLPDTAVWWSMRPVWMAVFGLALVPFVIGFVRFESPPKGPAASVSKLRLLAGASLTCTGLGLVSALGLAGTGGGLRVIPTLLPLVGTGLAGFGPLARVLRR